MSLAWGKSCTSYPHNAPSASTSESPWIQTQKGNTHMHKSKNAHEFTYLFFFLCTHICLSSAPTNGNGPCKEDPSRVEQCCSSAVVMNEENQSCKYLQILSGAPMCVCVCFPSSCAPCWSTASQPSPLWYNRCGLYKSWQTQLQSVWVNYYVF